MAELVPYPFARLITRAFAELEAEQALFHLPAKKIVRGLPGKDLSVDFHGHAASTPLGPAAGPHSAGSATPSSSSGTRAETGTASDGELHAG